MDDATRLLAVVYVASAPFMAAPLYMRYGYL